MNHVELIGIAGSGKSTLASELESRNREIHMIDDVHSDVVADLLFPGPASALGSKLSHRTLSHLARFSGVSDRSVNFFSMKYPGMIPKTAEYVRKYTDDPWRTNYISGKILDLIETFGTIDEHATDDVTLLVDEGFSFAAASILHPPQNSRSFSVDDLREYASTVPLPDAVVFVRASPETCISRIRQRESGFPPSLVRVDSESRLPLLEEAVTVAEAITDVFERRGSRIVEIETEGKQIAQSAAEVERDLSGIISL